MKNINLSIKQIIESYKERKNNKIKEESVKLLLDNSSPNVLKFLNLLSDNNISCTFKNKQNETVLFFCYNLNKENIKLLLNNTSIDPNIINLEGQTALMSCLKKNGLENEQLDYLADYTNDLTIKDNFDKGYLDYINMNPDALSFECKAYLIDRLFLQDKKMVFDFQSKNRESFLYDIIEERKEYIDIIEKQNSFFEFLKESVISKNKEEVFINPNIFEFDSFYFDRKFSGNRLYKEICLRISSFIEYKITKEWLSRYLGHYKDNIKEIKFSKNENTLKNIENTKRFYFIRDFVQSFISDMKIAELIDYLKDNQQEDNLSSFDLDSFSAKVEFKDSVSNQTGQNTSRLLLDIYSERKGRVVKSNISSLDELVSFLENNFFSNYYLTKKSKVDITKNLSNKPKKNQFRTVL